MAKKKELDVSKLSLGQAVDKLYKLRAERRAIEASAELVKADESKLEAYLIDNIPKSDATGVLGKTAKAELKISKQPTVKDWDKVYKYIQKTKKYELLQKRINSAAVKELWEDEKEVPGVEVFNAIKISLTKKG